MIKKRMANFMLLICMIFHSVTGYGLFRASDSIQNAPADPCSHASRLVDQFRFQEALDYLDNCYQADTTNIHILGKIASANYHLGRYKEAMENYQKILVSDSLNILALNQLGIIYLKQSNYSAAINQYIKLVKIDPDNSFYLKRLAELSVKKNDFHSAISYYEDAYEINPANIELIEDLSNIYLETQSFKKADSLLDKGIQLDPSNHTLKLVKARSSFKQQKYQKVVETANQSLRHSKDSSIQLMLLLGLSYYKINDHTNAISLLENVLTRSEGTEVVHCYLGLAYKTIGNMEKSIFHLEQAIDLAISDNISSYYFNLGAAYETLQQFDKSIPAYQAAYRSSNQKSLLYYLARNYDDYYKDKSTALRYYQMYISASDSGNLNYLNYSQHRISQLKEQMHFDGDSLH